MKSRSNELLNVMQLFYACTSIPISVYRNTGALIHYVGENRERFQFGSNKQLVDQLISELSVTDISSTITTDSKSWIKVAYSSNKVVACLVHPNQIEQGIFLLNPFSLPCKTQLDTSSQDRIIPYVITLLRQIQKDTEKQHTSNLIPFSSDTSYSFHIQKALDYLDQFYNKEITLESMAKHLGLNKCYFATIFKQETGLTFTQMLHKIRIEESKKQLRNDNGSILDIAVAVGFSNQNYFATAFKKATGLSPREFRNTMSSTLRNKNHILAN